MSERLGTIDSVAGGPPFRPIAALVHEHALSAPRQTAIVDASDASLDYGELDEKSGLSR